MAETTKDTTISSVDGKAATNEYIEIQQGFMGRRLARAYVPFQVFRRKFDPREGLEKGTIFPELYMPYRPTRGGL